MITKERLYTLTETAELLGTRQDTVGEVARMLGIQFKPVRSNGRAKGLTEDEVNLIRERLSPPSESK